jgi:hypothetical protein
LVDDLLIFWINLPLGALAVAVLNKPPKKLATVRSEHKLDLPDSPKMRGCKRAKQFAAFRLKQLSLRSS